MTEQELDLSQIGSEAGRINYPRNFIDDVKAEYPDAPELHESLDEGRLDVGQLIYIHHAQPLNLNYVYNRLREGRMEEVMADIKENLEITARQQYLHYLWTLIYRKHDDGWSK